MLGPRSSIIFFGGPRCLGECCSSCNNTTRFALPTTNNRSFSILNHHSSSSNSRSSRVLSCGLLGVRFVRHWARKAALEKQRRLPNRALRVGSCAAPLPPTNSSISSSSGCGFYGYMGDFVLRRCANGGFHLTPPFPAHSNPSLQQQQQQQRSTRRQQQIYKNVEYRDVVCLLPKPWGPEGPWGVETSRLVHRKKGKPPIHPVPKPATLLPH